MSYIVDSETVKKSMILNSPFLALRSSIVGRTMTDPNNRSRVWKVSDFIVRQETWEGTNEPFRGVLVRCMDTQGYTAFLEQDEAEVLLGMASAGNLIPWSSTKRLYVNPTHSGWVGFHTDHWSGVCDLYLRECLFRYRSPNYGKNQVIPEGTTLTRLLHIKDEQDEEESWVCSGDYDQKGQGPCTLFDEVQSRWRRANRVLRRPY